MFKTSAAHEKLLNKKNKQFNIISEWQQVPITITLKFIGMSEMEMYMVKGVNFVGMRWLYREIRMEGFLKQQAAAVAQGDEKCNLQMEEWWGKVGLRLMIVWGEGICK